MKRYSQIKGTGAYLPSKVLTNADLEQLVETSDEWIVSRSGIKTRHIATGEEDTAYMGEMSARRAMDMAGVAANQIDMIVVATATSDDAFPSTASVLQHRLGLNHVPAFDITAACAGFNYALSIANQYICSGEMNHILVVGSEMLSRILNWQDRTTCVLFGDGAGAIVLGASDKPGLITSHLYCDGSQRDILFAPNAARAQQLEIEGPYIKMNGREVFKQAVTRLGDLVIKTLAKAEVDPEELDWLIPHQANIRIIHAVAKRLSLPLEKVIVTLDAHGNTSAASVPLALDTAIRDGRVKRGDLLLLESFGGGLVWGSALVRF